MQTHSDVPSINNIEFRADVTIVGNSCAGSLNAIFMELSHRIVKAHMSIHVKNLCDVTLHACDVGTKLESL